MALKIDPTLCTGCADCEPECPTTSIIKKKSIYIIDAETCTECEGDFKKPKCLSLCPIDGCITAV
ncbi:MAG: 4Fe-4S binding protein [Hydrogenophilales bacterium]|nr:4Fe-4S binding protein [Hydrogenophilales bacterium]